MIKRTQDEIKPSILKSGIEIIAVERERQKTVEGFDAEHDSANDDGELARAAASFAMPPLWRSYTSRIQNYRGIPLSWPLSWGKKWWKPTPHDRIRELAKAGALIAAEIDRLQRKTSSPAPEQPKIEP